MPDNKYTLDDLVLATLEQKPTDFEAAFDNVITDRIRAAVEDKKIAIAQQMYNYDPNDQEEPEFENDDEYGAGDSELETEEPDYGQES
jgi:hypothetical protein